jgi:hypothetical protein
VKYTYPIYQHLAGESVLYLSKEVYYMFTNTIDPNNPLTPSEVVFLNGEMFAKKVTLGNVGLLHSDEKVSLNQLGQAILTTAVLACEQAGAFILEVQERKALLGLRKVRETVRCSCHFQGGSTGK